MAYRFDVPRYEILSESFNNIKFSKGAIKLKKLAILFSVLLVVFMGIWVFKTKTPTNRPDNVMSVASAMWWNADVKQVEAEKDWILDPEIPENYIPVPGEDELYMVVDEEGKITAYRHRTKQSDGTWIWETVNPDIPDNYEKVEGLEDVYKVINEDGTVSYFKYIRNEDDTFAFVPVDEKGNPIDSTPPSGSEIPENYKRVSGNVYAVYNENGVIIGYKERNIDENGNYYWVDCDKPKDTNTTSGSYYNGNDSSGSGISSDFPINDNIQNIIGNNSKSNTNNNDNTHTNNGVVNQGGSETISNGNGTYTQTETIITTETTGGWVITYQTVVTRTYSNSGELLSTKKDGPTEISKVRATNENGDAPDKSKVASTLSEEYARVSVGLYYDSDLAKEVVAQINAERAAAGLTTLTLSTSGNDGTISAIRAADMAIYNHSDYDSALYGNLYEMCSRFNVSCSSPTEVIWKTTSDKTASAIASRLQVMSNGTLTSSDYSSIGLSIVSKSGYFYIDAVLL